MGGPSKLGAIIFWRDFGNSIRSAIAIFAGAGKSSLNQATIFIRRNQGRRLMTDSNETTADALELLLLNQHAIAAGIEEVALWIEARGSVDTHDNITTALGTLDLNAGAIATAIEKLRQNH
jgi:hypothetical protein